MGQWLVTPARWCEPSVAPVVEPRCSHFIYFFILSLTGKTRTGVAAYAVVLMPGVAEGGEQMPLIPTLDSHDSNNGKDSSPTINVGK